MTSVEERSLDAVSTLDWEHLTADTQYLTHNIHRYSGKFIPQIAAQAIELLGGHAGLHVLADHVEDLGRQPSGHAHFFLLGRGLNGDMAAHEGVHRMYLRKALF